MVRVLNQTTFTDSTDAWFAAPVDSGLGPFVADLWYAMHGSPSSYTAPEVKNILDKFIAARSGANFPIYLNLNATAGAYYSGCDSNHFHATADGTWFLPMLETLYYSKVGTTTQFAGDATYLAASLAGIPLNVVTGLVTAATAWVPWGFQDGVEFTGDNLMGSLLYYDASMQMAALYTAAGQSANAAVQAANAAAMKTAISGGALWDSTDGMFYASSGSNNQIDVDGSAYAVWLGVASGAQQTAISSYLGTNYSALFVNGLSYQSSMNWATSWGGNQCAHGTGNYDDGTWPIALEWIATALAVSSHSMAVNLITQFAHADSSIEYVGFSANGASVYYASPNGALAFVRAHPTWF